MQIRAKHPLLAFRWKFYVPTAYESEKSFVFNFMTKLEELAADPRKYKKLFYHVHNIVANFFTWFFLLFFLFI